MATTTYEEYNGDGSDKTFDYSFPTYTESEVVVEVSGIVVNNYTIPHYTTSGTNTVTFDNTTGTTNTNVCESNGAPKTGTKNVRIRRDTNVDSAKRTYVPGSSVKAADLNLNQEQILRALQEEQNTPIDTLQIANDAITSAKIEDDAVTSAKIADGTIVDGNISSTAEIGINKLAHGTNNQVLQSDNSGNVEWVTNVQLPGNLDVNTNTTVGGTLGVTGTTTVAAINASGAVGVDGNFDVNTNKFTVEASTGNTIVAGTLGVTGTTTFGGQHTISSGALLNNLRLGLDAANEISTSSGNLVLDSATGTVTVDDHLTVTGNVTTNAINVGNDDNINIGASEDLIIKHETTGASDINVLYTAQNLLINKKGTSQQLAYFVPDGKAVLTYAGNEKFETTSGGAKVTGNLEVTGTVDGADVAAMNTKLTGIENNAKDDLTASEIKTLYEGNSNTNAYIDAHNTLVGGINASASEINSLNGFTGDKDDLNITTGMTKVVSTDSFPTTSDTAYPTAKRINTHVVSLINDVGGFVPIADEVSFPNANPDPDDGVGTIVSIADAGGLKVADGSGSGTYAGTAGHSIGATTLGGATVTITDIDTSLRGTTIAAGKGMLVQTHGNANQYTYHRLTLDEAGVASAQSAITSFNSRYKVHDFNTGNPSNPAEGNLAYDTNADKMKVYDSTTSAWKEVTSAGDFKYLFLCPAGGTGAPTLNGSIATYDLREGSNSGSAASVTKAAQLIVSVNGVVQKANTGTSAPAEGFALVDTNTIIFGANLASGDSVFIIQVGSAVALNHPAADSVKAASIDDGAILNVAINSSAAIEASKLDNPLQFPDDHKVSFGTDNAGDLEIYHSSGNSFIHDGGAGGLYIRGSILGWRDAGNANASWINANSGAGVELYYAGNKKFESTSTGAQVSNGTGDAQLNIRGGATDGKATIQFTSDDSAANSDNFRLRNDANNDFLLQNYESGSWEHNIKAVGGGTVELYHNDEKKFYTQTWGATVADATATSAWLELVTSDGTCGYLVGQSNAGSGSEKAVAFYNAAGNETLLRGINNGSVELYWDNSKKFETVTGGVNVTGNIEFAGDTNTALHHPAADALAMTTGGTERLRVDSTGISGNRLSLMDDGSTSPTLLVATDDNSPWAVHIQNSTFADTGSNSTTGLKMYQNNDGKFNLYFDGGETLKDWEIHQNGSSPATDNKVISCDSTALSLYHNGLVKLSTTSTGVTVYPGATTDVKCNITRSSDYLSFQAYKDGTDPTGINFQTQNDSGSTRLVGYFHEDGYLHCSANGVYTGVPSDSYARVQPKANRYLSYEMNSHSSDPYGHLIWFNNAAPDNRTNTFLICQDSGATRLTIYSDGDVLTSDAAELTSDQTLKENIVDATSKLEDLKKIKVRNFNWKASYHPEKSKKKLLGFIAQEVEQVFPALISEHDISSGDHTKDDHTPVMKKGIKQAWAPILVKALQEAIEKIETLETKVAALEAK